MKTFSKLLLVLAIALAMPAFAGAPAPRDLNTRGPTSSDSVSSPTEAQIVGFVSPMQGTGSCNDGATHLIDSAQGDFRLKPASPQAAKALTAVANGKARVAVAGHRVDGPQCVVFVVDRVIRPEHE